MTKGIIFPFKFQKHQPPDGSMLHRGFNGIHRSAQGVVVHHQHDGRIDATQRCRWKMWRRRRTDVDVLENRSDALVIRKAWTSTCWSENQPTNEKPISTIDTPVFLWRTHERKAPPRSHAWFFGRNFGWNLDGCFFFLRGECRPCHGVNKKQVPCFVFHQNSIKIRKVLESKRRKDYVYNEFWGWILHCFCFCFIYRICQGEFDALNFHWIFPMGSPF